MPTTRVAVCQYAIDIDDPQGTLDNLYASVAEAAEANPQVIVPPELCTSGYVFRDLDECWFRAEPADGPTVQLFRELSLKHRAIVVGGSCRSRPVWKEVDRTFRRRPLVQFFGRRREPRGPRRLPQNPPLGYGEGRLRVGDEPAPVVDTSVGKIAVMICYDAAFPEMVGRVARRGAQLVLAPSNWPSNTPPPGERAAEIAKSRLSPRSTVSSRWSATASAPSAGSTRLAETSSAMSRATRSPDRRRASRSC